MVIGGGASGLVAAIVAARNGGSVRIYEQMQRVGKKLLATGNGRCNVTNANIQLERFHGRNVEFARYGLAHFGLAQTIAFFESLGITLKEEEEGKLYPYSGQASSILDVLRYELNRLGVEEICETEVKRILNQKGRLAVLLKDGRTEQADRILLATGGRANANLGSTGSGYRLAMDLGHRVSETFPALVALKLDFPYLKAAAGVKIIGEARLFDREKLVRSEAGELLFTEYGISGPPILQLSRGAADSLNRGGHPLLALDLFPEFSMEQLLTLIHQKLKLVPEKEMDFCLVGLVNKKLIPTLLKLAGFDELHKPAREVRAEEIDRLVLSMKELRIPVTGTQPFRDAQVTAGGVEVAEVDEQTMESKLVKGLFFCGEILDIDGDCGGFNLQWAWTSGFLAGKNAAL